MSPKTEAAPQGETTRKHRGENVRLISLALAVLSFLMILALSYTRFYHQVELKTLDLRFRLRPPISVSAKIVMIDLDDESVLKFGRWPWPRTMMAELVDQITRYGVDNIFFDIEFIDPSGETLTAEHTKQDIQKKFDKLKGTLFTLIEKDLKHVEAGGSADELLDKLFQSGGEITREIRELETVLTSGLHDPDLALEQSFIRNGHIVCVFHFDTYIEERVNTGNILEEAILAQLRKNLDLTASDIAADLNLSIKDVELLLPRTRNRVVAETVREIVSSAGETFEIDLLADRVVEALPSKEAEGCRYRAEQFITRDLARKILLERFSLPLSRAKDYLPHFRIAGLVPIIPGLAQAVRGAGFANANPDIDGTFRRLPLFLNEGDRLLPQGAFMLSLDLLGAELKDIRFDERGTLIISPAGGKVLELPLDRNNMFLVNWAGGWQKPFKHLSVSELMTDREMEKVHWRLLKSAFELLRRREADHMDDLPGSEETITKAHETIVPELVDFATRLNRMVNTSDRLKNKPAMLEEALAR
ncbi:MAG: CHASE2 domain-containing protein, partial [bacterium]|nr:CHASE2 domain-containing protein [bacterium]